MADTKHTPGPWAVYGTLHPGEFIIHQGGHGLAVTRRANGAGNANARLIAAAPELLDLVLQYRNDLWYPPSPDSIDRRLDAIARVIDKVLG